MQAAPAQPSVGQACSGATECRAFTGRGAGIVRGSSQGVDCQARRDAAAPQLSALAAGPRDRRRRYVVAGLAGINGSPDSFTSQLRGLMSSPGQLELAPVSPVLQPSRRGQFAGPAGHIVPGQRSKPGQPAQLERRDRQIRRLALGSPYATKRFERPASSCSSAARRPARPASEQGQTCLDPALDPWVDPRLTGASTLHRPCSDPHLGRSGWTGRGARRWPLGMGRAGLRWPGRAPAVRGPGPAQRCPVAAAAAGSGRYAHQALLGQVDPCELLEPDGALASRPASGWPSLACAAGPERTSSGAGRADRQAPRSLRAEAGRSARSHGQPGRAAGRAGLLQSFPFVDTCVCRESTAKATRFDSPPKKAGGQHA